MPLALLDNVTKSYSPKEAPALKNANLAIEAGELVLIYGPNGAGKSTLLRLLGGLEKPTDGKIYLDGKNISRLRSDLLAEVRRRDLGFLSPEADLIPILTVFENVELPLQLAKIGKTGERRERVKQILEELGLGGLAGKKPADLSPLERQRTALAAAAVKAPLLILADEPTARLDVKSALEFLASIVEINKKRKTTILVAGDDLVLSRYLPRVIKLYGGVIEGGEAKIEPPKVAPPVDLAAAKPKPPVVIVPAAPPIKIIPPVDIAAAKPKPPEPEAEKKPVPVKTIPEKREEGVPVYEIKLSDLQSPLIKPPENRGKDAL
ncbi:hypothetical protein A3K48_07250 [candidate division WOR-1 bacterium RIFOXYA12_FULL_52_29]|uniref:ABC transporter domain-containing protein n=1 Tax=candidate division WOR-1 bacterium RIFOXYC12_FULL_54_18 TaxID=1802584 RepID=A0A1F4T861_UNCSA|nr:MAG: hypothetical protein A3K44_07250 [candidate division WOR-1 bacterium RIFOXYA2_FULL_51_19]OGC18313.1 MAG: hypothetical protein A3K48_07250 [candidate division WOR-1 bacterium RIFOXYA12_FULL_52_29]OGC27168.1 MAG: hypothetical protein A3K32_07245 [candidate division WOR-1 bacterium RIFOXYB2_FULL_45_9]OGC28730.1 MAG: hypothetical protein A3K49_07250 [candidate division WOR-1 bacterium RIFOXYC12_FULL_54_18]OGC30815.1 MAG: hypothetical protein A2346_05370 [candidate division WOR-1 bacterium R